MQAHSPTRDQQFEALGAREFDLLVVGGGITGCGIARDAALRGFSVALVEQYDFASGTSSRSSRLVHGGVRYLEHGQLHLVFESSIERRRLLKLAPHLVHPLEFTWPVYEGARLPRWKLAAGLTLYDALALFRNVGRHKRLSRDGVLAREPMLESDGLRGGATYFDARTNDARLTLANALGAAEAGGLIVNHAAATAFLMTGGRIVGATVCDRLGTAVANVRARVVVNAAGPWSDAVRRLDGEQGSAVHGSKGAHLAVPRHRIGNNAALTLLAPQDGRVFFVLPAGDDAIIGTTDSYTAAAPDQVRATNEDVQYLLNAANRFFPRAALQQLDVISAWAGIRPLVPAASTTPGAVSREHAITTSDHGLITITGGKLTTFRVMAEQVTDLVALRLARSAPTPTTVAVLPGGKFSNFARLVAEISRATNDVQLAEHLASSYGDRWAAVWNEIQQRDGAARLVDELPYTLGELRYGVRSEMARTLGDVLIRRTHLAFETRDHGVSVADRAAAALAPLLQWDGAAQRAAVAAYDLEIERTFAIER
jgi:glycerol-3-phosphate dehydrogenase